MKNQPAYRRMTWTDRLYIERLFNSGHSYRSIARITGFALSSLHREIKRGLYLHRDYKTWKDIPRYSADKAHQDAQWQATAKGAALKLDHYYDYASQVGIRVKAGESPDQITGDMKKKGQWTVSTTTLYRYIDRGYIPGVTNKNLQGPRKKHRYCKVKKAAKAPKGLSIEKRPQEIRDRTSPGHWEMDTVIGKAKGKGQAILVLTERWSRYEIIRKLQGKDAASVTNALKAIVPTFPNGTFKSFTMDNGSEFQAHDEMKRITQAALYYCHPYSSWERGSNENANKLIRRKFLKGRSLLKKTQKECTEIADWMNHMHRKVLNYSTAAELFEQWQETLR